MTNVVRITEDTRQECPIATLEAAKSWGFKALAILGFDEDDNFMCMTTADLSNKDTVWLLECARNRIFNPD